MVNKLLETALIDIERQAVSLLYKYNLINKFDKFDLINNSYMKVHKLTFNDLFHCKAAFYIGMEYVCKNLIRTESYFYHYDYDFFVSTFENYSEDGHVEDKIEKYQELIKYGLSKEKNSLYKEIIKLWLKGNSAKNINEQLKLNSDFIKARYVVNKAKTNLVRSLKDINILINTDITPNHENKTTDYIMYNDYPIHNPSFKEGILFLLGKEKQGMSGKDMLFTIAKNRSRTIKDMGRNFRAAVIQLENTGVIIKKDELFKINR